MCDDRERMPNVYTVLLCASPFASFATVDTSSSGREAVGRPALVGDLRIEEVRDEVPRRDLRTAPLWGEQSVLPHFLSRSDANS